MALGLVIISIPFGLSAATAKGGGALSERARKNVALIGGGEFSRTQPARARSESASCDTLEACQATVRRLNHLASKRLRLLGKREHRIVALLKLRTGQEKRGEPRGSVRSIICQVFGSQCSKALSVAWCESRFNVYARNGQYLGIWQMGSYARARYGHGWDAWTQTRAAHRYYLDAGWSPWACA